MAHEDEIEELLDGDEVQCPLDPGWLHRSEAIARLSCSATTLRRLIERGELHPRKVDNADRFDPSEIARLVTSRGVVSGQGAPRRSLAASTESDLPTVSAAEVIRASASLTHQAQDHVERMFEMTRKTTELLLGALAEHVKLSHAQTIELEKQNIEMRGSAERAKTEEHDRQLATLEYERRTKMQEKALDSLKSALPLLKWYLLQKHPEILTRVTGASSPVSTTEPADSKGVPEPSASAPANSGKQEPPPSAPLASPAEAKAGMDNLLGVAESICQIVASLSDEQLDKLRGSEALAPEHMEALVQIRAELRKPD